MSNCIGRFSKHAKIECFQPAQSDEGSEIKVDLVDHLSLEVVFKIFSYLNRKELARCISVDKTWKVYASDNFLWNAFPPKIAFGKEQWRIYFGDIGKEPPLPKNIHEILKSPCPFWPGKTVEETHMLVLIPKTVNGEFLNLIKFGEIVRNPKKGVATRYRSIWPYVISEHGNKTVESHWVLMTKNLVEGSKEKKTYIDLDTFVAELTKKFNYQVPNALDAVVCLLTHYICSKECLFPLGRDRSDICAFTICQERIAYYNENSPVVVGGLSSDNLVGGFNLGGLSVSSFLSDCVGVALAQKFF